MTALQNTRTRSAAPALGAGGEGRFFFPTTGVAAQCKVRLYAANLVTESKGISRRTEGEPEVEEFTLSVKGRKITATVVSPPRGKLAANPALLLTFAGTRDNALFSEDYCLPARAFLAAGHRVASFDLPSHGERVDLFGEGIVGFRNAFVAGVDPFARFVEEGKAVVGECIKRGWATPRRIVVSGTSRGGYMALRLLASDDRIVAGAGFAPVTDWRCLSEFQADRERDDVANLRLTRFVRGLAKKRVYLGIGRADDRVSTDSCRQLFEELTKAKAKAGLDASLVELNLTDDVGHTMGRSGYERGAQLLLKWASEGERASPR